MTKTEIGNARLAACLVPPKPDGRSFGKSPKIIGYIIETKYLFGTSNYSAAGAATRPSTRHLFRCYTSKVCVGKQSAHSCSHR